MSVLTEEGRQAGRVHPFAEPLAARGAPLSFAAWVAGIVSRWRLVAAVVGAVLAATLFAAVVMSPIYRTRGSFVTNVSGGMKLPSGLSGLGGLAAQFGISAGMDPSESPMFYVQLLQSRELLTRLVLSRYRDPRSDNPADSATLIQLFDVKKKDPRRALEVAIKVAGRSLSVSADQKTNLVTLSADAEWPELSSAILNRAVGLVNAFNLEQRTSRARAKRAFVEGRAADAQRELTAAETRLRNFYEQNRTWRSSPALTYEEGQLDRQATLANEMYLTLRRELETARLSELDDAALITVVDSAVAPRRPLWPRYDIAVPAAIIAGLMLGVLSAALATLFSHWASENASEAINLRLAARRAAHELGASVRLRGGRGRAPSGHASAHAATNGPRAGA